MSEPLSECPSLCPVCDYPPEDDAVEVESSAPFIRGPGRPKGTTTLEEPKYPRKIRLTEREWEYLAQWTAMVDVRTNETSMSAAVECLLERAMSFWPRGPFTNPRMSDEQLEYYGGPDPRQSMANRPKGRKPKGGER